MHVLGIVACNAAQGVIRNCIVKVKASRTFKNSGAIVGYNCGAVENCYAICTDLTRLTTDRFLMTHDGAV